jgi:Acetyl-CoA dehydrogenase C-terminal like
MWLKLAGASSRALAEGAEDRAFHEAKLVTARFYAERELACSTALRRKIEAGAEALMKMPVEAF